MKSSSPWPIVPLHAVVDVLDHVRVPVSARERAERVGDTPYYGASGQVGTIDEALFNEPLVLLGEDGVQFFDPFKPKAYLIHGPSWVNNHAHVLRPASSIDRRFLCYQLNHVDYRGFANGTTRLKLTQSAMKRIPLSLPDLHTQRRIVDILEDHLSRLDAATGYGRSVQDQVQALRRSYLHRLGVGPPVKIAELAIASGYGTSTKCSYGGIGPVVLRIPNVRDGRLVMKDLKRAATDQDLSTFDVRQGDVLIVRTNGSKDLIGRSAVAERDLDAAYASYLIRYRFDGKRVLPEWVSLALESPSIRSDLETLAASSAGQYNLSLAKLGRVAIPLPDLASQQEAVASFEEYSRFQNRLLDAVAVNSLKGQALRAAVLAAAFAGKLTGRHTDQEVIEELAQ
ncbi:MAG TPA: restriction endonuclease subunit S [Dermatophilaceae bacterium]|nr:restriction endonuclease subunit S [Dermatophilaceae bacterium]